MSPHRPPSPDAPPRPHSSAVRERLAAVARRPAVGGLLDDDEPPLRLRVVAGLFTACGALVLLGVGLFGVLLLRDPSFPAPRGETATYLRPAARQLVIAGALALLTATMYLWTGRLLRARSRVGGQTALCAVVVPLVTQVAHGHALTESVVVASAVLLALLLSVWRELD